MDDKVILDEKSFKALSADSRVNILKKLKERRMTMSELSTKLNLRGPTIKEHCNVLLGAELIKKIDEGRKWKYYELTGKGKQIVAPSLFEEARLLVSLCVGAVIVFGLFFFALQSLTLTGGSYYTQNTFTSEMDYLKNSQVSSPELTTGASTTILDDASTKDENKAIENGNTYIDNSSKIIINKENNNLQVGIALLGMLLAGIIIGWVARKKL